MLLMIDCALCTRLYQPASMRLDRHCYGEVVCLAFTKSFIIVHTVATDTDVPGAVVVLVVTAVRLWLEELRTKMTVRNYR